MAADVPYMQVQQQTPFGGTNWSGNTITTSYDPRLLEDFWAQTGVRNFQRDMYGRAAGAAANAIGTDPRTGLPALTPSTQQTGYDRSGMLAIPGATDFAGQQQRVEDATYDRFASRADTRFGDQQRALENQLRDQGFVPGTQGYDDAMRDFNFARNDAYQGAARDAVTAGGSEASRLLADALRIRGQQGSEAQQDLTNFNTAGNTNFGQRLSGSGQGFQQNLGAAQLPLQYLSTTQAGLPQGTMLPQFDLGLQAIDRNQSNNNAWMAGLGQFLVPALTSGLFGGSGGGGGAAGAGGLLSQIPGWLTSTFGNGSGSWWDQLNNPAMDPSQAYGDGSGWGSDVLYGGFDPSQYADLFPGYGGDMSWLNDAFG